MPEIDPVSLRLFVEDGQFLASLANVRRVTDQGFTAMERDALALERQMQASLGNISTAMKGLAATAGIGISIGQIKNLADGYTRYSNQLKVAGLEGEQLAGTQERLYEVAQRNGIELESVGTLYSRVAQNQKELGASSEDLINLTRAVSASLKISGTSTTEASGALLQLSQALGSPRVQAEEFNSLLDAMQPLLRGAAKYIDGTGGSISGLTRKIKDMQGPGVSNVELFRAITRAMADLEKTAESSSLTIGASFTILNNALGKYVGETDQSLSATARLSQGIALLADNLDVVVPAIATLAAVIGVRYVGAAVAATAATIAKSAADVRATLTAEALAVMEGNLARLMLGTAGAADAAAASVSRLAVAQGVMGRASGSLLALIGGPYGASVLALGAAYYYLSTRENTAADAASQYADVIGAANTAKDKAIDLARKLASATGEERNQTEAAIASALRKSQADKIAAQSTLKRAAAELALAQASAQRLNEDAAKTPGRGSAEIGLVRGEANRDVRLKTGEVQARTEALKAINDTIKVLKDPSSVPALPGIPSAPASGKKVRGKKSAAPGRSAADIEAENQRDLSRLNIEILQARQDLATSAEERADIQRQILEEERKARIAEVQSNKELSDKQKAAQLAKLEKLYGAASANPNDIVVSGPGLLAKGVNRDEQEQLARDALDKAQATAKNDEDLLRAQEALTTSREARRDIELRLIDLAYEQERNELEATLASTTATQAQKDIATARLAILDQLKNFDVAKAKQDTESPLQAYQRGINERGNAIGDQVEGYVVDELQHVQDSIASGLQKAIGTKDPLIAGLINLFIEQVIMKPIAAALAQATSGAGGGAGGFFGTVLGAVTSLFGGGGSGVSLSSNPGFANADFSGFASGGYTGDGGRNQVAGVVHKGEYVVPADAVRRIGVQNIAALTNARAAASLSGVTAVRPVQQTTVVSAPRFDLKGAVITPQLYADMQRISDESAARAGATSYKQSMKDAPHAVRRAQRFRTT